MKTFGNPKALDEPVIKVKDFEDFITQLKAGAFSDKGIEMGFVKFVDALIKDVNVLEGVE